MKDPSKNAEFCSSFSFTGTIARITENGKTMQLTIRHFAAGRFQTDFKLVIPKTSVETEAFPFVQGDVVYVDDALMYVKDSEVRLRIPDMRQIRATSAQPGEFNTLSFSGKIVEVKEEKGYKLVLMEQNVKDTFMTSLEVVIPSSVKLDPMPKAGDIGYISHALLYDKDGIYRARLSRPTYSILYTPDVVMDMGTIEAKEAFV